METPWGSLRHHAQSIRMPYRPPAGSIRGNAPSSPHRTKRWKFVEKESDAVHRVRPQSRRRLPAPLPFAAPRHRRSASAHCAARRRLNGSRSMRRWPHRARKKYKNAHRLRVESDLHVATRSRGTSGGSHPKEAATRTRARRQSTTRSALHTRALPDRYPAVQFPVNPKGLLPHAHRRRVSRRPHLG